MNRNGEVAIVDDPEPGRERERERYPIVYGAKLKKQDGDKVKAGEMIAEWDPYTIPILTEVGGVVKFGDILEGVTMEEKRRRAHRPLDQGHHRHARTSTSGRASRSRTTTGKTAKHPSTATRRATCCRSART